MNDFPDISFWTAFLGGLQQFFKSDLFPFIFAFLVYVAISANIEMVTKKALAGIFYHCIAVVIGFTATWIFIGSSTGSVGDFLILNQSLLHDIAAIIIIITGIAAIVMCLFKQVRECYLNHHRSIRYFLSFIIGIAFAFTWTLCLYPILSAILMSIDHDWARGTMLLSIYFVGLGVMFLISGLIWSFILIRLGHFNITISIISSILLVIFGILLLSGNIHLLNPNWYT